jgi:hypothetical protein
MSRITEEQIRLVTGNYNGLEDYFNKRVVRRQPYNATNKVTLGSDADFSLLSQPGNILPGAVISRNAVASINGLSNQGGIVSAALAGAVGASATTGTTDSAGNVLNLVDIREDVTNNEITFDDAGTDRKVYGLIQCSNSVTDSDVVGSAGAENIQISFVYFDATDSLAVATIPAGTYQFQLHTLVAERYKPVLTLEGGAIERDVIDLAEAVNTNEALYSITASFGASEVWDLTTGIGAVSGTSTITGTFVALPSSAIDFASNTRVQIYRNGVKQVKGVDVNYNSTTGLNFTNALAINEVISVQTPTIY